MMFAMFERHGVGSTAALNASACLVILALRVLFYLDVSLHVSSMKAEKVESGHPPLDSQHLQLHDQQAGGRSI
jgi:hypothetical protein